MINISYTFSSKNNTEALSILICWDNPDIDVLRISGMRSSDKFRKTGAVNVESGDKEQQETTLGIDAALQLGNKDYYEDLFYRL